MIDTPPIARPVIIRTPSLNALDKMFKPYAFELGKLVYRWNRMQESLCKLFWRVLGFENGNVPIAIWNVIPSDRMQRSVLMAGATDQFGEGSQEYEAVKWIVDQANSLADGRNDALHTPYVFLTSDTGTTFVPNYIYGNARAKKLKDKDLMAHLKYYQEWADVIGHYAERVRFSMNAPTRPWPEMPTRPTLKPSSPRKRSQSRKPIKSPGPRRRTSAK
jgi:hypothetical protein